MVGYILYIEATKMVGKGNLTLTGQLGDVMKESAQIAYNYVRSKADEFGIESEVFSKTDIHVHVPAGATPKDGPSAGVAMVSAIVSLLSQKRVRRNVGMTGRSDPAWSRPSRWWSQSESVGGTSGRARYGRVAQTQCSRSR